MHPRFSNARLERRPGRYDVGGRGREGGAGLIADRRTKGATNILCKKEKMELDFFFLFTHIVAPGLKFNAI